jgi:hypothetical protein
MIPAFRVSWGCMRAGSRSTGRSESMAPWTGPVVSMEGSLSAQSADRARMLARHKLIERVIEVTSRQQRCEIARAGLDLERAYALREVTAADRATEQDGLIETIELRIAGLDDEIRRLAVERDFLAAALTDFANGQQDEGRVGRA